MRGWDRLVFVFLLFACSPPPPFPICGGVSVVLCVWETFWWFFFPVLIRFCRRPSRRVFPKHTAQRARPVRHHGLFPRVGGYVLPPVARRRGVEEGGHPGRLRRVDVSEDGGRVCCEEEGWRRRQGEDGVDA